MLRLFRNSAVLGFGALIQRFLQLLLLPIYTRYLTPDDYGLISVLLVLAIAVNTLCELGLTNGISRYYFYAENEGVSQDTIVWSGFWYMLIASIIAAAGLIVLQRPVSELLFGTPDHGYLVALTAVQVLALSVASASRTLLQMDERMSSLNVWLLIEVLVSVSAGLLLVVVADRGVTGAIEAQVLGMVVPAVVFLRGTMLRFARKFSMAMLKKQLAFSLPLVAGIFAFWFIDSSDRYILNHYLPLEETGLYDMGYKLGTTILIVVSSFTSAWIPYYHRSGKGQAVVDDALKASLLITGLAVVLLAVGSPLMLRILTAERFHGAYTVVPMVVLAYVLKLPYLLFATGIQMKNRTGVLVILEIIAATVNVIGNLLMVPRYGREAAAVTTTIAYALMTVGSLWLVQRINPIPKLSWRLHAVTIGMTTVALVGFMVAMHRGYDYYLSGIGALVGFVVGMVLLFGVREMKRTFQDMVRAT